MAVTEIIDDMIPEDIAVLLKQFQVSAQLIVFGIIVAFNWCLMKILLSLFISSKTETNLRNICTKAQRQIYYFEAEKQKLQKEIDQERERAQLSEERLQLAEEKVIPLNKELAKLKSERNQLQQKVLNLESELESASEAGFEANRLLSDFLSSQKENVDLSSSVEALEQQIRKQSEVVTKYDATAKQKDKENRELKEKLEKISSETERLKSLLKDSEHNLEVFQTNNEKLKESKSELNSKLTELEEEYSNLKITAEEQMQTNDQLLSDVQKLTEEVNQLKEQNSIKQLEVESIRSILTKIRKCDNSSENNEYDEESDENDSEICDKTYSEVFDIVKMEVQVKNLTNDKNNLISKLEEVNERCNQLSQTLDTLEEINRTLKEEKEIADKNRMKAQMELEVMTKYYKEKELEFGKEIGVQSIKRQEKEEDANSMANRMATYEEENSSLRNDLKTLKKEIAEKERQYKSQINQLEKQVHENWILARNAERKFEEATAEASVLRQTLTMSVKSPVDGFGTDSFIDDSSSSISDHFSGVMPPPPPPPMPPPPMFNPMMSSMQMPYNEDPNSISYWNQNVPNVQIPSHIPSTGYNPIQSSNVTISTNPNISYPNGNYGQPMTNHWDSQSNRDTFSPTSQSNTSLHSQPMIPYSDPIITTMADQMNHFHSSVTSGTDIKPNVEPLYSSQSQQTISSFNYNNNNNNNINNNNKYNESEVSSRSQSTNQSTDLSLQTSMV